MNGRTALPAWKAEYARLTAERKTPNQRVICRHTSPIFLERHPVFLRKIGLVWQQILRVWSYFHFSNKA
jgi:hypothetical protein